MQHETIYETAVICKRIGWDLVFCARRTNEGGYAKVGKRTLTNVQSFVLKAECCFYLFL